MRHRRRIAVICSAAVLTAVVWGLSLLSAQTKPMPVISAAIIPATTVAYFSTDGSLLHRNAWEKTAAYEAFEKSGLLDSVSRFIANTFEKTSDLQSPLVTPIWSGLIDKGVTVSIAVPEGVGVATPFAVIVLHGSASHGSGIRSLLKLAGVNGNTRTERIGRRTVSSVSLSDSGVAEVSWWAEGTHLVVTFGVDAVTPVIAVCDGKAPSFQSTLAFKQLQKPVEFEVTSTGFIDSIAIQSRFGPLKATDGSLNVAQVCRSLGLSSVSRIEYRAGLKDKEICSKLTIEAVGPRSGLPGLVASSSVSLADLPPLPENNAGFSVHSIALWKAYPEVIKLCRGVAKFGPEGMAQNVDEFLKQLPSIVGCDLQADLFATLGSMQVVFSDLSQSVFGIEYGLAIQVTNPTRLRATVNRILTQLSSSVPDQFASVIRSRRQGQEFISIKLGNGIIYPTFFVSDEWLVMGWSSQIVESFALRLSGELPAWKPDAELQSMLATVPPKFASLTVTHPRKIMKGYLSGIPALSSALLSWMSDGSAADVLLRKSLVGLCTDLPPAEAIVQPLFPTVAYCSVDENTFMWSSRGAAPTIPVFNGADGSSVIVPMTVASVLLPQIDMAKLKGRLNQSVVNLQQMARALEAYHKTHDMLPSGTIPSRRLAVESRQSWMVMLLPYIGQEGLYQEMGVRLNDSATWNEGKLKGLVATEVMTYRNPNYPPAHRPGEAVAADYVAWAGVGKDAPTDRGKPNLRGVFGYDRASRYRDITDGTSSTIMVSEASEAGREPWARGGKATVRALTTKPYINGPDGIGGPFENGFYVLMADGTVKFISKETDPSILEKLSTRAGGEVVPGYDR